MDFVVIRAVQTLDVVVIYGCDNCVFMCGASV